MAFFARSGQAELLPIVEIYIEAFIEETFKKFLQIVHELGIEHATISTKQLVLWK